MMSRNLNLKKFLLLLLFAFLPFQNCGAPVDFQPSDVVLDSLGRPIYKGQLVVTPSKPNPPLKLFFVIDNSASMLGHQIDLGAQFSSLFQSASTSLQGFDTTIYVFSTASTYNSNLYSLIPSRAPSSISSLPLLSDPVHLGQTPGSIFSYWAKLTGTFGTAPYNYQLLPSPVLDMNNGAVTSNLFIGKKGSSSDLDYNSKISALTTAFKSRLSYLNPSGQAAFSNLTDVSSGLCSMARIVKHSSDYIQPGDSTAFIIASDDDDRLNLRNPNGNSCLESVVGGSNLVNGNCGHYQSTFNYNSSASISYYANRKFNYESGTNIYYSYPSSETCTLSYQDGYSYSSSYTALQTDVTYTRCDLWRDGTCITPHPNYKYTVSGSFVVSGGSCSRDMSALVDNPAPGASFSCVANNLPNQTGSSGVDSGSNGSVCSASLISGLQSSNRSNIVCTISGAHTQAGVSVGGQSIGACANYCSGNLSSYPNCVLTATAVNRSSGSYPLTKVEVQCNSTCPAGSVCAGTTPLAYLQSQYGSGATCDGTSAIISSIMLNKGVDASGNRLACSSSISGLTATDVGGNVVCASFNGTSGTIQDCTNSLINGTPDSTKVCTTDDSPSPTVVTVPLGVNCTTSCASSGGYCVSGTDASVASSIARRFGGYCSGSSSSGSNSFTLSFKPAASSGANCSSKCSDTISGSCDGLGFGATDNSTISDFIRLQKSGGSTCSSSTSFTNDVAVTGADAANPVASCATGKFFQASSSSYIGTATTYTTGDANHVAGDFVNFIAQGAPQASMAVITQMPGDNLYGTNIGQQYINLATQMHSDQISSIMGNYSSALNHISDFIVKSALNSFVLPIASTNFVYAVSILRKGSTNWQVLDANNWSISGSTLKVLPAVSLQIGDQILYQYRLSE